jgi:hypothetical protein
MERLQFNTGDELRNFYLTQGYFALYDCSTEYGELEIEHYSLLKSGEDVSDGCEAHHIINLQDKSVLVILERFLKTGSVRIHPNNFTI